MHFQVNAATISKTFNTIWVICFFGFFIFTNVSTVNQTSIIFSLTMVIFSLLSISFLPGEWLNEIVLKYFKRREQKVRTVPRNHWIIKLEKFAFSEIHGINKLVLVLITGYLVFIAFTNGINWWFATDEGMPNTLIGKFRWFLGDYAFFISLVCIATLWIKRATFLVISTAMLIDILLIANIDAPDGFFDTPSSFLAPALVVFCVMDLVVKHELNIRDWHLKTVIKNASKRTLKIWIAVLTTIAIGLILLITVPPKNAVRLTMAVEGPSISKAISCNPKRVRAVSKKSNTVIYTIPSKDSYWNEYSISKIHKFRVKTYLFIFHVARPSPQF